MLYLLSELLGAILWGLYLAVSGASKLPSEGLRFVGHCVGAV